MILRSVKYLGDTVHAYMIVKSMRDAGYSASLITNEHYGQIFDPQYLSNEIDDINFDFSSFADCRKYLTNKSLHVRDDIAKNFSEVKPISTNLHINPYNFSNKTVIICNRSIMHVKEWKGDWSIIHDFLNHYGYQVIFDDRNIDLVAMTSYIAGAEFVISIDTGFCHIADAYGIPLIGLYGHTSLGRYGPYSNQKYCIQASKMSEIESDDIINKIRELITNRNEKR